MAQDVDIWLPLYIGDSLMEMQDMSAAEVGGYVLLMMHAWQHGGHIPADDASLKRISRLSAQKLLRITHLFKQENGRVYHPRLRQLRLEAEENRKKKQGQTQKATHARWPQTLSVTDNVTDNVSVSPSSPPSPSTSSSPSTESGAAQEGSPREGEGDRVSKEELVRGLQEMRRNLMP